MTWCSGGILGALETRAPEERGASATQIYEDVQKAEGGGGKTGKTYSRRAEIRNAFGSGLGRGFGFWIFPWADVGEPAYARGSPLP